jgi:hypothetical protein
LRNIQMSIFALDVGVPGRPRPASRSSHLGWAGPHGTGTSLVDLVNDIAVALGNGPVHLYLEAPLFLPTDPAYPASSESDLCAMRPFEHSGGSPRAWVVGATSWPTSAPMSWPWFGNAGGAALGMGLQELTWILAQLKSRASGSGASLVVDTGPSSQPTTKTTNHSADTPTGRQSANPSTWQLTVLEAFHPRGKYPRAASAHGFKPLSTAKHKDVAKRIRDVAIHFGGSPCLSPSCSCPGTTGQTGVWFDSNSFPPGKGTFNLVALACWAAGVTGPARNAGGWVLCA